MFLSAVLFQKLYIQNSPKCNHQFSFHLLQVVTVLLNLKFLVSEKQNKIIFHRYACLLQHRCCCDLRREVKDRKMITTKKFVPIFNLYKVVCSWAQPTDWRSIFWLSGLKINTLAVPVCGGPSILCLKSMHGWQ